MIGKIAQSQAFGRAPTFAQPKKLIGTKALQTRIQKLPEPQASHPAVAKLRAALENFNKAVETKPYRPA